MSATSVNDDVQTQAQKARSLWLGPNPEMKTIESMYLEVVDSFWNDAQVKSEKRQKVEAETSTQNPDCCPNSLVADWQRLTVEQYCMILCQSGRSDQAAPYLQRLGYTCRLASCVLDYDEPTQVTTTTSLKEELSNHNIHPKEKNSKSPDNDVNDNSKKSKGKKRQKNNKTSSISCRVWDNFLSESELKHLRDVFEDPKADYWESHNYQVEPPSPYFSYIIPLQTTETAPVKTVDTTTFGSLGSILNKLYPHLLQEFPKLSAATAVELWAHNRPHPTGHQFHFDSDNEGQGKLIKNPIMTAILYLSSSSPDNHQTCSSSTGGPSIITNQTVVSRHLASHAVICHNSSPGRVVAFDGTLLHGVIPGKGSHTGSRRVTLMLAFWKRIRVRPNEQPGAARPFPLATSSTQPDDHPNNWNILLIRPPPPKQQNGDGDGVVAMKEQQPIPLDRVYETLDGQKWTKDMGFPEYDQVFQGF